MFRVLFKRKHTDWLWCFSSWWPSAWWGPSRPGGGCPCSRSWPGSSKSSWSSTSSSSLNLWQLTWTWYAWVTGGGSGHWGDDTVGDMILHRRRRQTPAAGKWTQSPPDPGCLPSFSSWKHKKMWISFNLRIIIIPETSSKSPRLT